MSDATSSKAKVLLVEDHALINQALTVALGDNGFAVASPSSLDAETVVACAGDFRPDVVLLDFYLEVGDSLPLVAPLVALGARVIMLTGVNEARLLGECLEAGATAVVSKSQPFDRLVGAIADAVEGGTVMRPAEREALLDAARQGRALDRERLAVFDELSPRERIVLKALMDGKQAEQIARDEFVSLATVRSQIRAVLTKLGVNSQLAAVALAQRNRWTG